MTEINMRKQRHDLKPIKSQVIITYLMTIDMPLLPLTNLMVYSLRLSQRVRNITTAMGSCISCMMKKRRIYGESNSFVN